MNVPRKSGNRLAYVDRHGKYCGYALIEATIKDEGLLSICEQPYIPFVWEKGNQIRLNVSGGAFHRIHLDQMTFVKKWMTCSRIGDIAEVCANGTVAFYARYRCGLTLNLILYMEILPQKHEDNST